MSQRGFLKELVLDDDARIAAAIESFEYDNDEDEVRGCAGRVFRLQRCARAQLLDTFSIIAARAK